MLEAALATTAAGQGLGGVHGDVTDLAARPKGARNEATVDHDSGTHARAEGDEDEARGTPCDAGPHLAKRRSVGIVDEGDARARVRSGDRMR